MQPQLYLFGTPRLVVAGTTVPLPSALAALAGYLGLCAGHGGRVARWRAAGAVWPELSEAQARRMVSGSVYRLRRLLGAEADCLHSDGAWLGLDVWLDVAMFRNNANTGDLAAWLAALDLYHADFLPDCDGDWLPSVRAELQQTYLATLERVTNAHTRNGNLAEALTIAGRWVAADPLNETAQMAMMRLYGRTGRYTAALQQYAQLETLLEQELGVAPLPETSSLAEQLRRELAVAQTRAATERQHTNRQPLIGRTAERAAMMTALETALAGRGGLVLIEGAPGMGKSRLLQELAAAATWRGFQVAWGRTSGAAVAPYAPLDQALAAIINETRATTLRAQLSPLALDALAGLVPHLRLANESHLPSRPNLPAALSDSLHLLASQTPTLLLLDDVQWASPAFWQALAFNVDQSATLSRRPLLIALAYRPHEMPKYASLAELAARWRTTRLALRGLSQAEVQELWEQFGDGGRHTLADGELAALYALTDGNPLYVQESGLDHAAAPQSFAQIIAERLANLGDAARMALSAAAVLGRDWPTTLWQQVAQQPVNELVAELSAARFIQPTDNGWMFKHDLIHAQVLRSIAAPHERELHERVAAALGDPSNVAPERLAWHHERAGAGAMAGRFYRLAGERAWAAFAYPTALNHFNQAFDLLNIFGGSDAERLALLCARQRVLGALAYVPAWRADVDALEALALQLHNDEARLEALEARIALLSVDSDVATMIVIAQTAAALAAQLGQPQAEARIWRAYAFHVISSAASPPADTLPMLQRAIMLADHADDHAMQVAALCTLAFAECTLGQATLGHAHAAQALTLVELYPELYPARGDVLRVLAHAALLRAEWETARTTMHKALHLLAEQDDQWSLATGLFIAVYVFGGMGQHAEARQTVAQMHELLRIADVAPYSNWSLYTYTVAIDCALQAGDFAAAEAVIAPLQEWLDTAPKSGAAMYLLTEVGATRLFQNRPREALRALREALPLWYAARSGFLPLLLTHALAAHLAGETAEAAESMRVAEEHFASHEIAYCAVLFHFTRFWVRGSGRDLQLAYESIQTQASRFRDASLRTAFLDDVRLHKMVALLWRLRPLATTIRSVAGLWLRITRVDVADSSDESAESASFVQRTVLLARADASLGKALREADRVAVVWTIHAPDDLLIPDKTALRHQRLRRLLHEAAAHHAAPTDDDLAEALSVSRRTILRDIALLTQTADLPPTRRRK